VKELRKGKNLTLPQLEGVVNQILEQCPELKKKTRKNPEGHVDWQTLQRLETGKIELTDRWLRIFQLIYKATPDDILGVSDVDEMHFLQAYRHMSHKEREALKLLMLRRQKSDDDYP